METTNGYDIDNYIYKDELEVEIHNCYDGSNSIFFTKADVEAMLEVFNTGKHLPLTPDADCGSID